MFKTILAFLLIGSNALASSVCYQAADTSAMKAEISSDNGKLVVEQISEASLMFYTNPKYRDADGLLQLADLSIVTDQGTKALSGSLLHRGNYSVECDGGRMSVNKNSDGSVTIKSDGIRADIEGCDGTLQIVTPGTTFNEVLCAAPLAN